MTENIQPDWSDAPSWAKWWAMDYMSACWYKQEPTYVKAGPRWIWYSQGDAFEEDRSVRLVQGIDENSGLCSGVRVDLLDPPITTQSNISRLLNVNYRETLRKRPEVQNDY